MSQQVQLEYQGKEYTLEYTRETLALIEKAGFLHGQIIEQPATMLPLAFQGAFLKNHKHTAKSTINDIFNSLDNKEELIPVLVEMIAEAINTLTKSEPNKSGNVQWKKLG